MEEVDIVVLGAGLSGIFLAHSLKTDGGRTEMPKHSEGGSWMIVIGFRAWSSGLVNTNITGK